MSTRCTIAILNENGTVNQIYCHHDGYFSYVGKILLECYDTPDKINALMELGDLSSLGKTTEHRPEDWKEYYVGTDRCMTYRDRGDSGEFCNGSKYPSLDYYLKNGDVQEYNYLYKDGTWYYFCEHYGDNEWLVLTKEVCDNDNA